MRERDAVNTPKQNRWGEFALEALIRVLGVSTTGFVLLIFLFLLLWTGFLGVLLRPFINALLWVLLS